MGIKVVRNLSDQGGGDNRALMVKTCLPARLVCVIRRHSQVRPAAFGLRVRSRVETLEFGVWGLGF